ncbi:2'-5' RNA ligase family protein [Dyella sp.]|jgi:2'-5' RNA ligase|uniref:2'-5' RNA ligase family protein n=1 Tax=Dyella sp. TaxID=1869338 RepID=UPI002D7718A4|nr:2'-5' RNA ligase family protein [Dyella sp.]HET6431301.1 2'-5' RNA ligase family protein [Dyella sp.]
MSAPDEPQIGLPGLEEPAGPLHRLFFALVPPEPVREQIAATARTLREEGNIQARWVQPARYHVTLAFLGDHPSLRPSLLEAARAAIGKVRVAPFTWQADQVASFQGAGRRVCCAVRRARRRCRRCGNSCGGNCRWCASAGGSSAASPRM